LDVPGRHLIHCFGCGGDSDWHLDLDTEVVLVKSRLAGETALVCF